MREPTPIVVVSPYRMEYGPPQTLGHVVRALSSAGFRPIAAVPPGARLHPDVGGSGAETRVVDNLGTVPRTFNVARLGGFFSQHLEAAARIEDLARSVDAAAIYSISEATFAGGLAARRAGIPSIVHVIGMSIQSPRVAAHVYVRLLSHVTDRFIACSSAVAEMLLAHGVEDEIVSVVHNGIDVETIEGTDGASAAADYPGPKIGMVAAYDPRKGHELFVDAAAQIAESVPDARFYIIGGVLGGHAESVAFEHRVQRLIAEHGLTERFESPGYVPAPEVYRWTRAMDVVVVPSRTEAFAHALLEAMACGKPVVATALEGNLDAFIDDHSGIFVERNPTAVAAAVQRVLTDEDLAGRLGANAREHVRLFDLSVTLPALAEVVTGVQIA